MINRQPVDPDVGQGIDSAPAVVLFLPTAKVCEQFVSCAVRLQEQLGKIQIQIQNTLLSVLIITIKRKFFFAHTSSATLTV